MMHSGGGGHDPHHGLSTAKRVRIGPGGMAQGGGQQPNTSLFGNNGTNSGGKGGGGGHHYNQRY
ncbi:hypothetical protein BLA29_008591 [Euroglyphus maynei]|uniref:Uncharacterized protein n=1 Tax=Euroglyphus maynei TaxID=6958 RepID=A0A1Y3BQC3_EURMA|nr:hypothetical protein BLA29_008591 [Euroglyphus maynei]